MLALIDGHMLGAGETGNETYIRGLLTGLEQLGGATRWPVRADRGRRRDEKVVLSAARTGPACSPMCRGRRSTAEPA